MSRLDFAPKLDDIKVTDIKRGLGTFTPKPDKAVSFAALRAALKKAGYALASADITVIGTLARDDAGLWIEADLSKQRFFIEGENIKQMFAETDASAHVEITGDWQTIDKDSPSRERIQPRTARKIAASKNAAATSSASLKGIQVSLDGLGGESSLFFSSVRTINPGLTVYKGGAVLPRYYYTRQHLGNLKVDSHALQFSVSYTPTPTLQLEAETAYQRTSFNDGGCFGSDGGFDNVILRGKYRFYRALETWGDKQAAIRFGLELPTGSKNAPAESELNAPEFVRRQLGSISGGLALHADVSFSQAYRRLIYGANIEAIARGTRDGFRTGHEFRINTDFEYVLLPFEYQNPGKELFVILETSYSYRGRGRIGEREVAGSSASGFYLAPGLQFTATPRVALEASYQFPVARNAGPLALRTDKSLLVGIKLLY
ncbi:MAG TPA: transporter [Blastocatellia bacterium]|nr:transporter [Blastocatellia bacterium]